MAPNTVVESEPGVTRVKIDEPSSATTRRAWDRGERLRPAPSERTYAVLTRLRQELERVIAAFVANKEFARLADFGCGNSPYRPIFAEHVVDYLRCDLQGNETADVVMSEPDVLPLDSGTVDVVLSTQVLEHVANPDRYLSEAHRVLRPNGLLILSTHGAWKYHPDPVDYWRWTSAGLKRIVAGNHFEVLSFRGILGPEAAAIQLWQEPVASRLPKRARRWFYRYAQWRVDRADRRCSQHERDRDASVYVVVARREAPPTSVIGGSTW